MFPFLIYQIAALLFVSSIISLDAAESLAAPNKQQQVLKGDQIGFNRPLVTITFDDGWLSVRERAISALKEYGYLSTFYIFTEALGQERRFTKDHLLELLRAGHEIGAHSHSHPHLNDLSSQELDLELRQSKKVLEDITGTSVDNFAAPFGEASPRVIQQIKKYFKSNRSADSGYNSKENFDLYSIKVRTIRLDTSLEEFERWLDQSKEGKFWLVFAYHQLDGDGEWSTTFDKFSEQMAAIKKRELVVKTTKDALVELLPQLKNND